MGAYEEAELMGLAQDKKNSELDITESMNNFAREIKNGLGSEIIEELNRKPKPKSKIRLFFEKIFRTV